MESNIFVQLATAGLVYLVAAIIVGFGLYVGFRAAYKLIG